MRRKRLSWRINFLRGKQALARVLGMRWLSLNKVITARWTLGKGLQGKAMQESVPELHL